MYEINDTVKTRGKQGWTKPNGAHENFLRFFTYDRKMKKKLLRQKSLRIA